MLLGNLDLAVGPALDDRRVVRVDQVGLGVQLLDELVVGLSVIDVVIYTDQRNKCVHRHGVLLVLTGFVPRISRGHSSTTCSFGGRTGARPHPAGMSPANPTGRDRRHVAAPDDGSHFPDVVPTVTAEAADTSHIYGSLTLPKLRSSPR